MKKNNLFDTTLHNIVFKGVRIYCMYSIGSFNTFTGQEGESGETPSTPLVLHEADSANIQIY